MVSRFSLIPGIMGCHDGPVDLRATPDIDTTPPFHDGLLWLHCSDALLQCRCKLSPLKKRNLSLFHCLTNSLSRVASQHDLDFDISHITVGLLAVVSGQLFPHGVQRFTTCNDIWSSAGRGVGYGLTGYLVRPLRLMLLFININRLNHLGQSTSAFTLLPRATACHVTITSLSRTPARAPNLSAFRFGVDGTETVQHGPNV
jgi:hypothetical protein